VRPS
jgi:hypothetical protein